MGRPRKSLDSAEFNSSSIDTSKNLITPSKEKIKINISSIGKSVSAPSSAAIANEPGTPSLTTVTEELTSKRKKFSKETQVETQIGLLCLSIIKSIKNLKDEADDGREFVELFLELPSKSDYPDYYEIIERPISIDLIEKNIKDEKYSTIQEFLSDIDLMCKNAMTYNDEGSEVYNDAARIQKHATEMALSREGQEKKQKTKATDVQKMFKAIKERDLKTIYDMISAGYEPDKYAQTHDLEDSFKWAALHCACFHGHKDIVEKLLQAGANIELPDKLYEGRPLAWAAYGGHVDICKMLLDKYNADPTAKNAHDQGPWDLLPDQTDEWGFLLEAIKNKEAEPALITPQAETVTAKNPDLASPRVTIAPSIVTNAKIASPAIQIHPKSPGLNSPSITTPTDHQSFTAVESHFKKKRGRPRKSDLENQENGSSKIDTDYSDAPIDTPSVTQTPTVTSFASNTKPATYKMTPAMKKATPKSIPVPQPAQTQAPVPVPVPVPTKVTTNIPPVIMQHLKRPEGSKYRMVTSIGLVSNANLLRQIIPTDIHSHCIVVDAAVRTLNIRVLLSKTDRNFQLMVYHNQKRLVQLNSNTSKENDKSSMQDYNSLLVTGLNTFEIFAMYYPVQEYGRVTEYEVEHYAIYINKVD